MTLRSIMAAGTATTLAVGALTASSGAAPAKPDRNIVQTAVAAGQFTTLTSLVQQAGLAPTLAGKGRFTVFAPTDEAFAKVPESTLTALGKDRAKLRKVLLHHVAKGRLTASTVAKRRSIRMLDGTRVAVRTRGGKVYVGGARVTSANVRASNGIIHVIDAVLIPR